MVWVKWEKMLSLKIIVVGTSQITSIYKGFNYKSGWRLIMSESLWNEMIFQKYVAFDNIEEWINKPITSIHNVSIIWNGIGFPYGLKLACL